MCKYFCTPGWTLMNIDKEMDASNCHRLLFVFLTSCTPVQCIISKILILDSVMLSKTQISRERDLSLILVTIHC